MYDCALAAKPLSRENAKKKNTLRFMVRIYKYSLIKTLFMAFKYVKIKISFIQGFGCLAPKAICLEGY